MQSGKCPKCGSENLEYDSIELESCCAYYPLECKDCGFIGREWYELEFSGFTDDDGNEMEDEE